MQKEKIIRTEEEIEYIKSFIINHGFTTMTEFAKAIGMKRQNLSQRIRGKCNPDIRMLLKWAIVLHCDVMELIRIFYPEEYKIYMDNWQ